MTRDEIDEIYNSIPASEMTQPQIQQPEITKSEIKELWKSSTDRVVPSFDYLSRDKAKEIGRLALQKAQRGGFKPISPFDYSVTIPDEIPVLRDTTPETNVQKEQVRYDDRGFRLNDVIEPTPNITSNQRQEIPTTSQKDNLITNLPQRQNPSVVSIAKDISDFNNSVVTPDEIQRALDPSVKITPEQEARFKRFIKNYEQNDVNENATTLVFDEAHPDGMEVPIYTVDENGNYDPSRELTDEQKQFKQDVYKLKSKLSEGDAVLYGASSTLPGASALARLSDKDGEYERALQNAKTQNKGFYRGGNVLGFGIGAAESAAGGALLEGTQYANALDALGHGGGVARRILAESLKDAPIDVITDTIPQLLGDINSGKSAREVALSTLGNIGLNQGMNTVFPFVQNFGDVLSAFRGLGRNSANVADDVVDNALNPLEMAAKNAEGVDELANQQREIAQNLQELADQLPKQADNALSAEEIRRINELNAEDATRDFAEEVTQQNVNPQSFDRTKIVNKELNDTLDSLHRMYEREGDAPLMEDLRASINEAQLTGNEEALQRAKDIAAQLDEINAGRKYYTKKDREIRFGEGLQGTFSERVNHFEDSIRGSARVRNTVIQGSPEINEMIDAMFDRFEYTPERAEAIANFKKAVDNVLENPTDANNVALVDSAGKVLNQYQNAEEFVSSYRGKTKTKPFDSDDIHKIMQSVYDRSQEMYVPKNASQIQDEIPNVRAEEPNRVMAMRATTAEPEPEIPSIEVPLEEAKGYVEDGKRRVITNSAVNANVISPEDIANSPELQKIADYEKHNNVHTYMQAERDIAKSGEQFKQDYINGSREINSDIDVDRGMILLQDIADQIKNSDDPSALIAERNAILRNMATHGTEAGQFIQAFAKYADTADEALVKATKIDIDNTNKWASRNKKAVSTNRKLAEALKKQGYDGSMDLPKERMSIEEYRQQVRNTLDREFSSIDEQFTDADVDYLSNLIEQGATVNDLVDALNTKMATGRFGISDETQKAVNDIFDNIRQYDENSQEFVEGQSEAFRLLAKEIAPKASTLEKFDAWRYMAMLGNPKTMLRNFVGNKMFGVVTGISNNLAAAMESGTDRVYHGLTGNHIQRTKAILNPVADKNLIDAAHTDGFGKRYRQFVGSKYEKSTRDALLQEREVFDSRPMQLMQKAVDAGISDTNAVAKKYSTSLAGYLKANGYDASVFDRQAEYDALNRARKAGKKLTESEAETLANLKNTVDMLEKARDYALEQAEYATFHEDNKVAQWITKSIRDARNSDSAALNALGFIGEGVLPFKKTPANILRSGAEYSPLGALKSIRDTGKLIYENTGWRKGNLDDIYTKVGKISGKEKQIKKTLASDVIDSWSKTLTGSGLAYLGYYLFDKGILTSSRNDEKYQDQLEGKGNYGININGHHYTLDWAAPGVMPLLLGAEIKKIREDNALLDKEWYESPDRILETVNAILDPMFETSMLSGVKDTFQTAANEVKFNENNTAIGGILGALAGNALTGYATQAIPTLSGQIARTVDPIRRTTDTINENILGTAEKQGRKVMNKIPFLSKLNTEYRDAYGRSQNNSPFEGEGVLPTLGNLAYQMLSPGYYSRENVTDADASARQAYNGLDESGKPIRDSKAFAEWNSTKRINGEKLDPEQMQTFREAKGQANYGLRDALAHNEWFNGLSSSERTDTLKSINSLADKIGQYAVAPDSVKVSGDLETYLNNGGGQAGIDAVIKSKYQKSARDEAGVTSSSNIGKMINEAIESGNTEQAQKIVEDTKSLADLGLDKPAPSATYTKAQTVIPNLTTEQFAIQYKAIDADGNQGIKQDEIIKYLNKGSYKHSEAMQIWNAYGNSGWKKIPVLEDGKWKLKSK